jgi:hypothetical protein
LLHILLTQRLLHLLFAAASAVKILDSFIEFALRLFVLRKRFRPSVRRRLLELNWRKVVSSGRVARLCWLGRVVVRIGRLRWMLLLLLLLSERHLGCSFVAVSSFVLLLSMLMLFQRLLVCRNLVLFDHRWTSSSSLGGRVLLLMTVLIVVLVLGLFSRFLSFRVVT